jgi:hypothetical protein
MRRRIRDWVINIICSWVVVGGNCGLCGKWVKARLVPRYWRWTMCDDCASAGNGGAGEGE